MTWKSFPAVFAALIISGCAANYPPLMAGSAPPPANSAKPTELDRILADAADLQAKYGSGYKDTAQWQDFGQLPIIGAAAWAAWVLLVNKPNAAMTAGKIGIGAGAYSMARGQLTAGGLPEAYIAGHGALTCVIAEGSTFTGQEAEQRYQDFDEAIQAIVNRIETVTTFRNTEPSDPAANADTLKAAREAADQAIAAARVAEKAAREEEGLFNTAAPRFRNAISSISVRVASKGRVRPPLQEFGKLRDSLAPPKEPETGKGQAFDDRQKPDTTTLVKRLLGETSALISLTAALPASTPPYRESLDRVKACPDLVS